jgi:hypothetical protein
MATVRCSPEDDNVTLIKDLKLKGSSTVFKRGTMIKTSTSPTTKTRSQAAPGRASRYGRNGHFDKFRNFRKFRFPPDPNQ